MAEAVNYRRRIHFRISREGQSGDHVLFHNGRMRNPSLSRRQLLMLSGAAMTGGLASGCRSQAAQQPDAARPASPA